MSFTIYGRVKRVWRGSVIALLADRVWTGYAEGRRTAKDLKASSDRRGCPPPPDYKQFPFRVLMVFKTAERRNNTTERLLQNSLSVSKQVCFSTFEEVTRDPFGAIWINSAGYHEATKGTLFHPERQSLKRGYRRQPEREALVESKVKKFRLLEN